MPNSVNKKLLNFSPTLRRLDPAGERKAAATAGGSHPFGRRCDQSGDVAQVGVRLDGLDQRRLRLYRGRRLRGHGGHGGGRRRGGGEVLVAGRLGLGRRVDVKGGRRPAGPVLPQVLARHPTDEDLHGHAGRHLHGGRLREDPLSRRVFLPPNHLLDRLLVPFVTRCFSFPRTFVLLFEQLINRTTDG